MRKIGVPTMFAVILTALSQSAATDDPASSDKRKYDVCRTQIEEYVDDRFHQTVSRIVFDFVFDYRSAGGGDGTKSTALAYTEDCPGYHVFELFATDFDCDARAHAGAVPNYVFYRTSEDGC